MNSPTTNDEEVPNGTLVLGEFNEEEVKRCALDKIHKKDRSFQEYEHYFANGDQFDLFQRLPGGNDVKERILSEMIEGEKVEKEWEKNGRQ